MPTLGASIRSLSQFPPSFSLLAKKLPLLTHSTAIFHPFLKKHHRLASSYALIVFEIFKWVCLKTMVILGEKNILKAIQF
jgi:predicted metal-binding membrane protein